MLIFKTSNNTRFSIPESWADVTLKKFLLSLNLPEYPQALKDLIQGEQVEPNLYNRVVLPYFCKVVSFWAVGLTEGQAREMNKEQLRKLFFMINLKLKIPKNVTYKKSVKFKGIEYFLPEKHMRKSTVNEFVDAAQLEHFSNELKENNYLILPDLCAILLRRKGEKYNQEFEKKLVARKKLFLQLPMKNVFEVAFFLLKQSEQLNKILRLFSAKPEAIQ